MKKILKWLTTGLLALFTLITLGLIYLSLVLDPNQYKSEVESMAKGAGVELAIEGDLEWQFFPLGVRVNQVNFALQDQSMAGNINQLAITVNVPALLTAGNQLYQLPVNSISVINGRLLYAIPDSLPIQFSHINFDSSNISYDGELFPVFLSVQAPMGLQLSFESNVGVTFTNQEIAGLSLSDFKLGLNKLRLTGDIKGTNQLTRIQGNIDIQAFNLLEQFDLLQRFAPNLYIPQMNNPKALSNVALNSQFNIEPKGISEIQTRLTVDDQKLDINLLMDQPNYKLTTLIAGDSFNLTSYLPKSSSDNNAALFAPLAIPLAVWHGQSQMELHLNQLQLNKVTVSNIYANLLGNQNIFKLTSLNADAFDGQINATATLDMQTPVASFDIQSSIANLNLAAMTEHNASESGFSGIVNLEASIQGSGNQTETIMKSLKGGGNLTMLSPVYKDINVEKSLCDAASLLSSSTSSNQPWSEGTQLDDLVANFRLDKGRLVVTDYQTGTGNITLSGNSTVDLLAQSYRFSTTALINKPKTSDKGCSVSKLLQNRQILFHCDGKFGDKARCRPDSNLLNSFIKRSATDNLNRKFKKGLEGKKLSSPLQQLIDKNLNRK